MAGMADTYIKETEEHLVHTYNRFPVVLERGEGVFLYDTEGRRYLDFAAGIAVCSLGYGNKELQCMCLIFSGARFPVHHAFSPLTCWGLFALDFISIPGICFNF